MNSSLQSGSFRTHRFFNTFLGAALMGFGAYVVFVVLLKVRDFIQRPESLEIFLKLVPEDPALRTLTVDAQVIVLPLLGFHYAAYMICIFLLFLAGLLGVRIMVNGINLLIP